MPRHGTPDLYAVEDASDVSFKDSLENQTGLMKKDSILNKIS
jgi:hypothetical protein